MSIADNVQTAKTARCGLLDRAVKPGDIIFLDRLRALDREGVERLKESISRIGLKTPISVRLNEQGWTLVSGRHRLEACIELGMDEIPVVVETVSELGARLWEIAENLHRAELTALERAEHISQWIGLRGERGEGEPCDRADDKLDQVGPVSGVYRVAQMAQLPAPGGTRSQRRPSCRRPRTRHLANGCAARGSPGPPHRTGGARGTSRHAGDRR